jgi:hypothetical protein
MTTRAERLALNQAMFRVASERISAWPERRRQPCEPSTYYCECARTHCCERLSLTSTEYEGVRAESWRFAIAPGHEDTDVECVVDDHRRFAVVEKFKEVAQLVDAPDPRAETERLPA